MSGWIWIIFVCGGLWRLCEDMTRVHMLIPLFYDPIDECC